MKSRKVTAIGCGAMVVLFVVALGILGYGMLGHHPYYATGVAEHELAPASATSIEVFEVHNISGVKCLTYRVSEEAFVKFAESKGWPLTTGSGSVHVRMPSDYFGKVRKLSRLERYLTHERRHRNGGGITVYYIPAESRAYIDKSNR